MKHLLSIEKLSRADFENILADSVKVKKQRGKNEAQPLAGQVWALLFSKSAPEIAASDVLECLGYQKAADPFALPRLIQERRLKSKKSPSLLEKLPPLGTLDDLISTSMGFGFVFITLGVIFGVMWAYIELGTSWVGNASISLSLMPTKIAAAVNG